MYLKFFSANSAKKENIFFWGVRHEACELKRQNEVEKYADQIEFQLDIDSSSRMIRGGCVGGNMEIWWRSVETVEKFI